MDISNSIPSNNSLISAFQNCFGDYTGHLKGKYAHVNQLLTREGASDAAAMDNKALLNQVNENFIIKVSVSTP